MGLARHASPRMRVRGGGGWWPRAGTSRGIAPCADCPRRPSPPRSPPPLGRCPAPPPPAAEARGPRRAARCSFDARRRELAAAGSHACRQPLICKGARATVAQSRVGGAGGCGGAAPRPVTPALHGENLALLLRATGCRGSFGGRGGCQEGGAGPGRGEDGKREDSSARCSGSIINHVTLVGGAQLGVRGGAGPSLPHTSAPGAKVGASGWVAGWVPAAPPPETIGLSTNHCGPAREGGHRRPQQHTHPIPPRPSRGAKGLQQPSARAHSGVNVPARRMAGERQQQQHQQHERLGRSRGSGGVSSQAVTARRAWQGCGGRRCRGRTCRRRGCRAHSS